MGKKLPERDKNFLSQLKNMKIILHKNQTIDKKCFQSLLDGKKEIKITKYIKMKIFQRMTLLNQEEYKKLKEDKKEKN